MGLNLSGHKRILMVLYYYYPYTSGVSVYAKRLAEGLVQAGHEVTVLTSRFEPELPATETIAGVKVVRRPVLMKLGKGVIMPFFWLDIIRYARRADYVNLHLPMADSGLSALLIPKFKQITTYHCDLNLGSGLLNRAITAVSFGLMRLQLHRSRSIVVLSRDYFAHSKMSRHIGKVEQVYPPIDAEDFRPTESSALFRRLVAGERTVKIGFVGRIVYEKGIEYLLDSIPRLAKSLPDFKILIVGDYQKVAGGSIKDELDSYLERWPGKIIFTGFLSDEELRQFYSGLDVFVLPSIDPLEAFGLVQVEAMFCGTPVVASNLPGVREVITKTGYGRLSRPKDPTDIAECIVEVVTNPKEYRPDRRELAKMFDPAYTTSGYTKIMR